jgi:phage major head subunit gpT-like protein
MPAPVCATTRKDSTMLPQQFQKITTEGVRGMILARLDTGSTNWINSVAMRMTSMQASEEYAWLGSSPALREFIGGRTPAELRELSFIISNKDFETSLRIQSKDMRRDKLGMIEVRINQLADRALDHPAKLLSTLILNGASATCYDGQYFFDTDHSEGESGVQSNALSRAIVDKDKPTGDEMADSIMECIMAMYGFQDDRGEPMNQSAREFTVMVGPSYLKAAMMAVKAILGTGGKSATLPTLSADFTINVVVNPRLSAWTDRFVVLRTDEAAKPFILQEEDIPDVVALGDGSEYEQLNREHLYGIDWTGNVGYGYWQMACLMTHTTA